MALSLFMALNLFSIIYIGCVIKSANVFNKLKIAMSIVLIYISC